MSGCSSDVVSSPLTPPTQPILRNRLNLEILYLRHHRIDQQPSTIGNPSRCKKTPKDLDHDRLDVGTITFNLSTAPIRSVIDKGQLLTFFLTIGSTSPPRSALRPQLSVAESARSGLIPTRPARSPTLTPVKLSENSSQMASSSASQSPCTPDPALATSQLHEELVDTVVSVRGRVPRMLVCLGMMVPRKLSEGSVLMCY